MSALYFKEIFCIVGYERSGTTMLRSMLSNSSQMNVHIIEPQYILHLYQIFGLQITNIPQAVNCLYNHRKYPKRILHLEEEIAKTLSLEELQSLYKDLAEISLQEFILRFYHTLYAGQLKNKLLIKYPEFVFHLKTLKKIFPWVKIISIVRDPRAAIASSYARWPATSFTYRCNRWNNAILLSKRWEAENAGCYMEIVYEKLLTDSNDSLAKLCHYLGISMEDKMINFHSRQDQWSINNGYTEKEFIGVDKTKIDSWKEQLNAIQVKLIEKNCKKWMKKYHYTFSNTHLEGFKNHFFAIKDRTKYVGEFIKIRILYKIITVLRNKLKYA